MTGDQQPFNPTSNLNQRLNVDFALQAAGLGVWELDPVTKQVLWDDRCRRLFGLSEENQLPYEQAIRHIHPDDVARVDQAVQRVMDPRSDGQYDITYRTIGADDGLLRWVRFIGRSEFTPAGEPYRFAGVAQEVTSQVLTQQKVEQAQQQIVSALERLPVGMGIAVLEGEDLTFRSVNTYYSQLVGRQPEELIGKPLLKVRPELEKQGTADRLRKVIANKEDLTGREVASQVLRNGQLEDVYTSFVYTPQYRLDGSVSGVIAIILDVTAQVKSRQAIEVSQQRLLALFEQSSVGIASIEADQLTFRMANLFYGYLVGREPEQIIGKPLLEALPELAGQGFDDLLREVIATGVPFIASEVPVSLLRHGELETIYIDMTYQPQFQQDRVIGVFVVATEVTQQVRTRQEVEASEAKLRSVIATAPAGIGLFMGRDLIIENPNQTFVDIVGKGWGIVGKPLREAMPELITENQAFLQILDDVFTSGQMFQSYGSLVQIVQHGVLTNNYYNITYSPLFDEAGQVYAILDIAIDVTGQIMAQRAAEESEERYRLLSTQLEAQVQERTEELAAINEEMTATNEELLATNQDFVVANRNLEIANMDLVRSNQNLEQFAYIASHDLQEPLRKIQQFGDLLQGRYGDSLDEGTMYLERMQVAARRMSLLIKDLLAFSRISTRQAVAQPVSLNEVVNQALDALSVAIEESGALIEIDSLPTVQGDSSQLSQVFQNLLSNAIKFRRNETAPPHITVRASSIRHAELPATVQPARYAHVYQRIDVADDGIGFEEKYTDRIFQVFQRLHGKNEFAGTGVGLAIVQKVVTNHGGSITATSIPGEGATFSIYLPA